MVRNYRTVFGLFYVGEICLDDHFKFPSFIYFRTRYFSESRQGHTPLQGRAYYQMMECLGVSLRFLYSLMSKLVSQSKFKTFNAGGKTSGKTYQRKREKIKMLVGELQPICR